MDINSKTVLITGASEGIGAACVEAFRRRGARISIVARTREKLERVGGPDAVITAGDLTDPDIRRRAVDATLERFGSIDILINSAGVGLYAPSWRAEMAQVRQLIELNLFVPMELTQLVVPHMIERGSGMIVNLSSIAGKVTLPWMAVYSASKYAICSWTDGLRMELKSKGIHTLTVCPGYVRTGFQDHMLSGKVPGSIQQSRKSAISAAQCAEAIAKGVERGKRTVLTPRIGWVLVVLERLFPSGVDWWLERMYREGE